MRDGGHEIWSILGIAPTGAERDIKRAYARLLKTTRPEDDPEAFQRLRDAYDYAIKVARHEVEAEAAPADAIVDTGCHPPLEEEQKEDFVVQLGCHPPLAPYDPMADARAVWDDFIAPKQNWPKVNPVRELEQILASDALIDLETRDAFEFLAARYSASSIADRDMREVLVKFFDWENSISHLIRFDEQTAWMAVGRYRADKTWDYLNSQTEKRDVIQAVLADTHPRFALKLMDERFVHDMRELLSAIRWQWQDLEHYRLNASVVSWWIDRVNEKRYYMQTARDSALAGLLLFAPFFAVGGAGLAVFVACQLAAFAAFAWFSFHPPGENEKYKAIKEQRIDPLLHLVRPRLDVQYAWLLPLLLFSLAMFIPEPPFLLKFAVTDALLATLAVAVFACSLQFGFAALACILLAGWGGGMILATTSMGAYGVLACACCAAGVFLQTLRGGESLFTANTIERVPSVRTGWLLTAALIVYNAIAGSIPAEAAAVIATGWGIAGSALAKIRVTAAWLFAGLAGLYYLLRAPMGAEPVTEVAVMLTFLIAMGIIMLGNMVRARQSGQQFS